MLFRIIIIKTRDNGVIQKQLTLGRYRIKMAKNTESTPGKKVEKDEWEAWVKREGPRITPDHEKFMQMVLLFLFLHLLIAVLLLVVHKLSVA